MRRWRELPEAVSERIQSQLMGDPFKDVDRSKYVVVQMGKPQSWVYVDEGELRFLLSKF